MTYPEGTSSQLQDCFKRTNWDIFANPDLEEYTSTILCYICTCVDNVTINKHIWVYPNQKPQITKQVKTLLRRSVLDDNSEF